MTRLNIDVGTQANDGTGDDLRAAMQKVNTNFTELYGETAVDQQITISGNEISSNASNANIVLSPSGTGAIEMPAITIDDNAITGTRSNDNLNITASGTGSIVLGSDLTAKNITQTGNTYQTGLLQLSGSAELDNISINGSTITSLVTNGDVNISANGTGDILLNNAIQITGANVSSMVTNTDLGLAASGTGNVNISSGMKFTGETLTGDGSTINAISTSIVVSFLDADATVDGSTIANMPLSLATGVTGQIKIITMIASGASAVLTSVNGNLAGTAASSITWNAVGQSCTLLYNGTKWVPISNQGCTIA